MVFTINKDPSLDDDYLDLQYRELTPQFEQIIDICKEGVHMLLGEQEGKKFNIDINDIMYIEWVDNRSCICTSSEIYTCSRTLLQLEQQLSQKGFVRISKPMLVNVYKVKWVSSGMNMKLSAELANGECVTISRHYRSDLLNAIYNLRKESSQ